MRQLADNRFFSWLSVGLACGLITSFGCGGGDGATSGLVGEEATVHGKVTIKGQRAKGGTIYFDPTTPGGQSAVASAEIGKDGTYTVKTLTGEYRVNVRTPETEKDPNLSAPEMVTVNSGDNAHDVTLPHP
jgi:hypothetical protein